MSGPNYLSAAEFRDFISTVEDIPHELVTVPEWGDAVIEVRGMNGDAQASHMARLARGNGKINWKQLNPSILRETCFIPAIEGDGPVGGVSTDRLFEGWGEDQINRKAASALQRLARVAQRLSGLQVEEAEDDSEDDDDEEA